MSGQPPQDHTGPATDAPVLGSPPEPDPATRELTVLAALALYDQLGEEGAWDHTDRPSPMAQESPEGAGAASGDAAGDELAQRRARRGDRLGATRRWVAAAAVAVVAGMGGLIVANQGGEDAATTEDVASSQGTADSDPAELSDSGEGGEDVAAAEAPVANRSPDAGAEGAVGQPQGNDPAQATDEVAPNPTPELPPESGVTAPQAPPFAQFPWPPAVCRAFALVGIRLC